MIFLPPIAEIQPCLESLREMLSMKLTYNRQRNVIENAKPAVFLAASTTPGCIGQCLQVLLLSIPVIAVV